MIEQRTLHSEGDVFPLDCTLSLHQCQRLEFDLDTLRRLAKLTHHRPAKPAVTLGVAIALLYQALSYAMRHLMANTPGSGIGFVFE